MIVLLILCLALLGVIYALSRKADHFIFHPIRGFLPGKLPAEPFWLPTPNGGKIQACCIAARNRLPTILFFHGNGGNISHFAPFAQRYAGLGYGVLWFDYQGFGNSTGRVSARRCVQDGQTALNYLLRAKNMAPKDIVIWGFSLGNAIALRVLKANEGLPFRAAVLQSPFTSATQMGAYRALKRYAPRRWSYRLMERLLYVPLWNKVLDNRRLITRVQTPLLAAYSKSDEVIPWQMSRDLAARAPKQTRVFVSEKGYHNEFGWLQSAAEEFLRQTDYSVDK